MSETIPPAERAWQAWYEPEHDISRAMATSPYDGMHAAFLAAWEAAAAAEHARLQPELNRIERHSLTRIEELAAAQHAAVAKAVAAEGERISKGAEELKFTLFRPGPGNGPAHGSALDVVPLAELLNLTGETGD